MQTIGITSNIKNEEFLIKSLDNVEAILKVGGAPIILPNIVNNAVVDEIVERIDGLLLTGGSDVDPTLYGEEPHPKLGEVSPDRDKFEMLIVKKFLELDKPILGICRGCQVLNVAAGGDLYQDIYAQCEQELLQHRQEAPRTHMSHYIKVTKNSLLHQTFKSTQIKVNSYHHQSVKNIGSGFIPTAYSSDGIIEAIESKNHRFAVGVQWHPENLISQGNLDTHSYNLFSQFIDACKRQEK